MSKKYIGYREADYQTAYAKFFKENLEPMQEHAKTAIGKGVLPAGSLPALRDITSLLAPGYSAVETGFTLEKDGSARVAVWTKMPGVTPEMWNWWFAWHGSQANRYKLWHPLAHQDAQWQDGSAREGYVGRVSMIEERIGTRMEKANIGFVSPTELGFSPEQIADKSKVVFICARLGYTHLPLDFGYLVHQVRATPDGAEMRSRFFMGGENIQVRGGGPLPRALSQLIRKLHRIPEKQALDLMQHCAEEMNHLATILPTIYAQECTK